MISSRFHNEAILLLRRRGKSSSTRLKNIKIDTNLSVDKY
jgi:hypothetical protein